MSNQTEPLQEVDSSNFDMEQPSMEVTLKEFDTMVEKLKAYKRLISNPDFILIINDDYLGEDLERNTGLLTVMRNKSIVEARPRILERIYAKGHLIQWLKEIGEGLDGIDNPEQRVELVKQLEEIEAEKDSVEAEEA